MRRLAIWLGLTVAAVALLAVIGGLIGDRWLESSGGRRLLEDQLTQAVGSPVRLSGSYRFRVLPRILIAGTGLEIGPPGEEVPVRVASFRTVVGLIPLLRGDLRIDAIELTGGRIDVDGLGRLGGDGTAADTAPAALPAVAELVLREIRVFMPGQPVWLMLERLVLTGFRPDEWTPLALDASLVRDAHWSVPVSVAGSLRVAADAGSVELTLRPLAWRTGALPPFETVGQLVWQADGNRLAVQLAHERLQGTVSASLDVAFAEALSGTFDSEFRKKDEAAQASAGFGFSLQEDLIRLDPVTAALDGQALSGQGCIVLGESPALNLSLFADTLDLERLAAWIPEGPGGAGEIPELPFELALEIDVAQAALPGANAQGVRVVIGRQAVCPDAH